MAPLIEETVFRGWLSKDSSKWYYYISSFLFGIIHIINFEWNASLIPFIIIITSPQIFIGLLLGYIRINYGFWYAVLLHSVYNLTVINIGYGLEYYF